MSKYFWLIKRSRKTKNYFSWFRTYANEKSSQTTHVSGQDSEWIGTEKKTIPNLQTNL